MTLFEIFAVLGLKIDEFRKNANAAVQEGQNIAGKIQTKFSASAVAVGNILSNVTANLTKTVIELAQGSLNVAAEVQAANAQFEAAFGGLQGVATAAFEAIGKEINVLPSRLKEVGTKGFSQLKGAGLSANEALEESQRLMRLAADAAAYYDISLEAADERLRSFMRGNTEAGDAIGLFTSESQRDSAAVETYGKKWLDLTEAQKEVLMLNIAEEIYKQSGAIGQAERESNSWSNTLANLKESWRLLLAEFGAPFLTAFTPIVLEIQTFLTENKEKVGEFSSSLAEFVGGALQGFIDILQWIMDHQEAVSVALGVFETAFLAIQLATHPIRTIFLALIYLGAVIAANWEELSAVASTVWEAIKTAVANAWNGIVTAVQSAIDKVKEFFGLSDTATSKNVSLTQTAVSQGRKPSLLTQWADAMIQQQSSWYPGKASGLGYVPYDNYGAFLHRGEAVLTRQQAEEYRRNQSSAQPIDTEALAGAIVGALSGLSVTMDGKKVGNIVTEQVSRNIAKKTRAMRGYAT